SNSGLFEELKRVRKQEAQRLNVPAYIVFGDKALHEMVTYLPQTEEDFLKINGVGSKKLSQFGKIFMLAIRQYVDIGKNKK
ncbi:MAG: HRDC domain-containing protein, partial [bacterium]